MDDCNNGITKADILRIGTNPQIFKWNYWNGKEEFGGIPYRIRILNDPLETIRDSEVLLYRPETIVIKNKVLKKQWLGHDDNGFCLYGNERLHEDYVMCFVSGVSNGYVAYRSHPANSFILDDIYVHVHLPHSEARFTEFSDHTQRGVVEESVAYPIERRTITLDEFIEKIGGRWSEAPLVFKEGENLGITTANAEFSRLISPVPANPIRDCRVTSTAPVNPIGECQSMRCAHEDVLGAECVAKQYLTVFKTFLDELGIAYRKSYSEPTK